LAIRCAFDTHAAMLRRTLLLASVLALAGCLLPPSPAQRLAESAYDYNTATRWGRMDLASENVRDTVRDQVGKSHAGWGKQLRIVDCEVNGFSMRSDGDADVSVTVSWQRYDETIMRNTDIAQRWSSVRGTWRLISEEEHGGDKGLLAASKDDAAKGDAKGDAPKTDAPAPAAPTPAAAARSRYQTRTIYEQ
jgi:hypothetical protein